jgi:glycosyltransferase involved in cell wall biosynthesis
VKIAIMMRAIDQPSGFQAFMIGLITALLRTDHTNTYLLLYRTRKFFNFFSAFTNAKEILVAAPHKLLWDQIAVPWAAWKERAHVIYNPKFSIPLISHCPVVMGLQEPAWWAWPEHYEWLDVWYMRLMLPIYCMKTTHFFPWSQFTIDENKKYLKRSFTNCTITYPAANDYFRVVSDASYLAGIREKYQLPLRFILGVTRIDHPGLKKSTSFFPGKNVETTLRASAIVREQTGLELVIAGRGVREYLDQTGWGEASLAGVHFPGFVPHQELPALYNLADLFVIPTFYEGFGFTLVEAMTCGCPVVASQTGACPEISGGAALLADPNDPAGLADRIMEVLSNEQLRQDMRARSLERARFFDWDRAARLTLQKLTEIVEGRRGGGWAHGIGGD